MTETKELNAAGVIVALVYRSASNRVVVLRIHGAPPGLEPFADTSPGGDWDEVHILFEDAPPQPPKEEGLWELSWPWHSLTAEEREAHGDLLCCMYEGKPQWQRIETVAVSPATALLSSPGERAPGTEGATRAAHPAEVPRTRVHEPDDRCSFCGRVLEPDNRVVVQSAYGTRICDLCVKLCAKRIRDYRRAERLRSVGVAGSVPADAAPQSSASRPSREPAPDTETRGASPE